MKPKLMKPCFLFLNLLLPLWPQWHRQDSFTPSTNCIKFSSVLFMFALMCILYFQRNATSSQENYTLSKNYKSKSKADMISFHCFSLINVVWCDWARPAGWYGVRRMMRAQSRVVGRLWAGGGEITFTQASWTWSLSPLLGCCYSWSSEHPHWLHVTVGFDGGSDGLTQKMLNKTKLV